MSPEPVSSSDRVKTIRLLPPRRSLSWAACLVLWMMLAGIPGLSCQSDDGLLPGFEHDPAFGEQNKTIRFAPDVRIVINAPARLSPGKKTLLMIYVLPNGNSIEWTIGKQLRPGDDWHYDIQHIAAQPRYLRRRRQDRNLIVAYLENDLKSWPAWRRQHPDQAERIRSIIDTLTAGWHSWNPKIALCSHSGGGSFVFGYLNTLDSIPAVIERIAFLDSNYGFDENSRQITLLDEWLRNHDQAVLTVIAYNDSIALLDGKPFVSATGGTWVRSRLMARRFAELTPMTERRDPQLRRFYGFDGRLQFILKENPERNIYHTVLVARNGLIHSLLAGTADDEKGYRFFGEPVYRRWIAP